MLSLKGWNITAVSPPELLIFTFIFMFILVFFGGLSMAERSGKATGGRPCQASGAAHHEFLRVRKELQCLLQLGYQIAKVLHHVKQGVDQRTRWAAVFAKARGQPRTPQGQA